MTHKQYVEDLVKLQDKEGKRVSGMTLEAFKRLFKASQGDLRKLLGWLKILKPKILKEIAVEMKQSVGNARKLGQDFGESKLV